jgi:hypothetical protein
MNSVLNIEISMFADARSTTPKTVILLDWLKDESFLRLQERVRACATKNEKDIVKKDMPCITPSGLFSKRGKDYLIQHSGFIAIDIDGKDNTHISNFFDLKNKLCKLSQVAYCGLSVSGQGYWALIPIAHPDKHEKHYQFLEDYFAKKGLNIDPACKDVARLRFYSYDPDAYFNHNAKQLQAFYSPPIIQPNQYTQNKYFGDSMPVWDQYNTGEDFIFVLERHGWKIDCKRGRKIYFTRPGKDTGISAEFDPVASWVDKNTGVRNDNVPMFHVYSSNGQPFESGKGYTPFMIYTLLEHGGDGSKAAKSLIPDKTKSNFKASAPAKIQPHRKQTVVPAKAEIIPDTITKTDAITKPPDTVSDRVFRDKQGYPIVIKDGYPAFWDEPIKPGTWSSQIDEFEKYFNGRQLPTEPVQLKPHIKINDVKKFIESHISTLRANDGNKYFIPYLDCLNDLRSYLEN